jgi:hypothetical protein
MWAACLLFIGGFFWVGVFNPSVYGTQTGMGRLEGCALALGYTIGGGWLAVRRRQRHRRNLSATTAEGTIRPTGHHVKESTLRRWMRLVTRCFDYGLGTAMCFAALFGAAAFSNYVHGKTAYWFTGQTHTVAVIGTHVVVAAAGFAYSQLISGGAIRAMNTGLGHDWAIKRNWHYILLAPPFLLVLPAAVVAPGLALGAVTHLVNLWIGWRFTDERPTTPLRTLKEVRQRRVRAHVENFAGSGTTASVTGEHAHQPD